MSFVDSSSMINGSLAWSMGNGGTGRIKIGFPFNMAWYHEQPCKEFQALEHRKERKGLEHEFIVLHMTNGSICKLERMGDPNARLNALDPQGSLAQDFAQMFPHDTDYVKDAGLNTSDIVSKIEFPEAFDLKCVLNICRAIHEANKTRSYTLQVYNCYFFALAIQCCLTRFVAVSNRSNLLDKWLDSVEVGIATSLQQDHTLRSCPLADHSLSNDIGSSALARIYSFLTLGECDRYDTIKERICSQLRDQLRLHESTDTDSFRHHLELIVDHELWFSRLKSIPSFVLEQHAKSILLDDLARAMEIGYSKFEGSEEKKSEWVRRGRALISLVSQAKGCSTYDPAVATYQAEAIGVQVRQHSEVFASSRPARHLQVMNYRPVVPTQSESSFQDLILDQLLSVYYSVISKLLAMCLVILLACSMYRPGPDPTPCTMIEQKIKLLLSSASNDSNDAKPRIPDVGTLAKDKTTAPIKPPWAELLGKGTLADNTLEEGLDSKALAVSLKGGEMRFLSIGCFQKHILTRIEDHAKRVEAFLLGFANQIQAELIGKLSEIWGTIREDTGLVSSLEMNTMSPELAIFCLVGDLVPYASETNAAGFNNYEPESVELGAAGHSDLPLEPAPSIPHRFTEETEGPLVSYEQATEVTEALANSGKGDTTGGQRPTGDHTRMDAKGLIAC